MKKGIGLINRYNFFFGYIYYRAAIFFMARDGKKGISAIMLVSAMQLSLGMAASLKITAIFFTLEESRPYFWKYRPIFYAILVSVVAINYLFFTNKFDDYEEHWKSESTSQYAIQGYLIILAIIGSLIPLILVVT
jgi:C4-dicarboxylate transporter